jgi:hypothetical protein
LSKNEISEEWFLSPGDLLLSPFQELVINLVNGFYKNSLEREAMQNLDPILRMRALQV